MPIFSGFHDNRKNIIKFWNESSMIDSTFGVIRTCSVLLITYHFLISVSHLCVVLYSLLVCNIATKMHPYHCHYIIILNKYLGAIYFG